jgi:hypothetical protein
MDSVRKKEGAELTRKIARKALGGLLRTGEYVGHGYSRNNLAFASMAAQCRRLRTGRSVVPRPAE